MSRGTVLIERDRCKACELCVVVCPQHLLHLSTELNTRGYHSVELNDPAAGCTGCALCALVCPDVVFTVFREPARQRRAA